MDNFLCVEIAEAVAEAKGVDPRELEVSLHEYVEMDALEQLLDHDAASWTFSFELPNHDVTVTSDGVVLVDGTRETVWV